MQPKVLLIDIESAPILANVWGLFKQNVSLDMIQEDWYIMSFAAKWVGEDNKKIIYEDCSEDIGNDHYMLQCLHKLLDEADFIIAHNGDAFDRKKINARLILNGFEPPSPYRVIDTLKMARKDFKFTSNKLMHLTDILCEDKKLDHGKFAGFKLWKECMLGNKEAWREMKEYNIMDIISLEELYYKLRPWYSSHPVFSLYGTDVDTDPVCPKCGSNHQQKRGKLVTNAGVYQRYHCQSCGGWSRSRYSTTTKETREGALVNA